MSPSLSFKTFLGSKSHTSNSPFVKRPFVSVPKNPNAAIYVPISIAVAGVESLIRLCLKIGITELPGKPVKEWKEYEKNKKNANLFTFLAFHITINMSGG